MNTAPITAIAGAPGLSLLSITRDGIWVIAESLKSLAEHTANRAPTIRKSVSNFAGGWHVSEYRDQEDAKRHCPEHWRRRALLSRNAIRSLTEVRLGLVAPREVIIDRSEVHQRKLREYTAATSRASSECEGIAGGAQASTESAGATLPLRSAGE